MSINILLRILGGGIGLFYMFLIATGQSMFTSQPEQPEPPHDVVCLALDCPTLPPMPLLVK